MKTVNWNQVLGCDYPGLAYSTFHAVILEKCNKCFPLRKSFINRYTYNSLWLIRTLKESINVKNKFDINRNKADNKEATLRWQ